MPSITPIVEQVLSKLGQPHRAWKIFYTPENKFEALELLLNKLAADGWTVFNIIPGGFRFSIVAYIDPPLA